MALYDKGCATGSRNPLLVHDTSLQDAMYSFVSLVVLEMSTIYDSSKPDLARAINPHGGW